MSAASPPGQLKALAASAMIGTDRGGAPSKAGDVLARASVLGAQARAGYRPQRVQGRVASCPPDARPAAGPATAATLLRLLADPDAGLIEEWSELAQARGVRVPDELAPVLLDWWSRQPRRPEAVLALLGPRGAWLASLNEAWRKPAVGTEIPADAEALWQTGTAPERAALLLTVRRLDPARGVALVRSTWESDGADERRRFVEALGERCSMADEPFLEAALDDKSKLVRRAAAGVLGGLPGSRLRARFTERARTLVVVERGKGLLRRGVKASLAPPQEFDKSWERDGVEEQAPGGTGKRAWWMRQVLGAADLSVLTEALGLDPDGVLDALSGDDHFDAAMEALSGAAARDADPAWCAAILRRRLGGKKVEVHELHGLLENLAPDRREPLLLSAAAHTRFTAAERWAILASAAYRWSESFSHQALTLLGEKAPRDGEAWGLYEPVQRVSGWVAPAHAERFAEIVAALFPGEPTESFRKSVDRARLRADMHKEFAL